MHVIKLQLSEVDVLALSTKLWQRGRRLYGWDDFAGRRGYE